MIKAVLFDVDGLVVIGEKGYFSERYAREYNVPLDDVAEFFTGNFRKCTFGKADLKEEIAPYLKKWHWPGTTEDFLKYWFEKESKTDQKVLGLVQELRKKSISCHIATRQEKYRAEYFWDTLNLKDHFDGMFCTCEIGYDKNEPEFWDTVTKQLGMQPEEILFFDDSQKNIDFTKKYGVHSQLYQGFDSLRQKVEESFSSV